MAEHCICISLLAKHPNYKVLQHAKCQNVKYLSHYKMKYSKRMHMLFVGKL